MSPRMKEFVFEYMLFEVALFETLQLLEVYLQVRTMFVGGV